MLPVTVIFPYNYLKLIFISLVTASLNNHLYLVLLDLHFRFFKVHEF